MQKPRGKIITNVGNRLLKLREQLELSPGEMAARLGVSSSSYYKNENGETLPGMISVFRLHKDLKLSIDWLLFGTGEMYLPDEQQIQEKEAAKTPPAVKFNPELAELIANLEEDPLLRHEIMVYFYKYKQNKDAQPASPPGSTGQAPAPGSERL